MCVFEVWISTSSPLLQARVDRHVAAVDVGADRSVADVGVNRVGEIERRRAPRQRDEAALGREAEHLVLEQLELGVLEKLLRIGAFEKRLHQAPQPHVGAAFLIVNELFDTAPFVPPCSLPLTRLRRPCRAHALQRRTRRSLCMSRVRICSSTRWWRGPTTVV